MKIVSPGRRGRFLAPLLLLLLVCAALATPTFAAPQEQRADGRLRVYYAAPPADGPERPLHRALRISPVLTIVADPQQAEVLLLDDARFDLGFGGEVRPAVLVFGPNSIKQAPAFRATISSTETLVTNASIHDPILDYIPWGSAPQVRERSTFAVAGSVAWRPDTLVRTLDSYSPLLMRDPSTQRYVFTPWLDPASNKALADWPYFNYLVYVLLERASGHAPLHYADYPAAPVPHESARQVIAGTVFVLFVGALLAFVVVRRYSLRHPEELDNIVADLGRFRSAEAPEWEQVGFHRPLAGFLLLLALGLLMFIPLMIYQVVILPRYLLPSAQALGAWSWVVTFFQTFWILFDMGTSIAFVKYFSELRVKTPAQGIKYAQLFVWWQALSGTLQLGAVALVAAYIIPYTDNGFMSWYFVVHALIQFPGFLRIFQYALRAFQRLDYDQGLNILATMGPLLLQAIPVLLLRWWGEQNPAYGGSMGGAIGMGVGLFLVEVSVFVVGWWLYRRLGYGARVLFLAHFDRETVRTAFRFGGFVTLGGVMGGLGYSVQVWLMSQQLHNYAEVLGNWNLALGLNVAYSAIGGLYNALMPGLSEAYNNGKPELTRYYLAQAFKYGGWFSAFICGGLVAVSDRFILGSAGPEFTRAAEIVGILLFWGALQYPAWLGDRLQEAAGRPWLVAATLAGEQLLRIVLMFVLVEPYQLTGLLVAYLIALPLKGLVSWLLNLRLILAPRLYFWQWFAAPALAGLALYAILRFAGGLFWGGDQVTSLILFFLAIVPALPLFCFLHALCGGWDRHSLTELQEAAELSGIARPFARVIYASTALGARLSPLHDRFPIQAEDAEREAKWLTAEKVPLWSREAAEQEVTPSPAPVVIAPGT